MKTSIGPKTILIVLAFTLATSLTTDAALVAQWSFNETSGTTANDTVGSSHGTLSPSGAAFVSGGISGGAISLNRSANGFVNMSNVFGFTNGNFSLVAWIKTSDQTPDSILIGKHAAFSRNGYYVHVNQSTGLAMQSTNKAFFYQGGTGVAQIQRAETPLSTTSVNDGNWHQIVAVYSAGGVKTIYVDGAPAEDSKASQAMVGNTAAFLIGGVSESGVPKGRITALVDEVQLYSHTLSDADIDYLFQNPSQNIVAGGSGLVNGSFEAGLTGWTVAAGSVLVNPYPATPSDGTNYVMLGGGNVPGTILSQTFGVTSGSSNTLSFDITATGDAGRVGIIRVDLTASTGLLISQRFTNNAQSGLPTIHQSKFIPFTVPANVTNVTLSFADLSPNNGVAVDPVLDNVRILVGTTNPPLECVEQVALLTTQLATANTSNAVLRAQIVGLNQTNENLRAQISLLQRTNNLLLSQLTTSSNTITLLQGQLATANASIAELQALLAAAQASNATLQTQLNTANNENTALRAQLDHIAGSLLYLEDSFAEEFGNPAFVIPGSSVELQVSNIVSAIKSLNRGQQRWLFNILNGETNKSYR